MTVIESFLVVLAGYTSIWALYLLLLPSVTYLWQPRTKKTHIGAATRRPRIAVIIPAWNAGRVIAQCIGSIRACAYPMEEVDIYVVADHCTDDTVEHARLTDVTVFIRDAGPKGKTYALAWAFDKLSKCGARPDLYVIVDSTARVASHFLSALVASWRRGEDMITSHPRLSVENHKWVAQCMGLMLVHRTLQNRSRERLGLSAMLNGVGMAYSRGYIARFGWRLALPTGLRAAHPTEDWRHGVRAAAHGVRVAFADEALVFTPLRQSMTEATKQGVRWERGRMINATTHALRLLLRGVQQRHLLQVCAALDAMQPPVAILGALSLVVAAGSVLAPGVSLRGLVSFIPCLLIGWYGLLVVARGRREGIRGRTIVWAPLYIVWRCTAFVLAWGFLDRLYLSRQRNSNI